MPSFDDAPFALRIATGAWAAISLIQFTVWAVIGVFSGHLDAPWPLWSTVPSAIILAASWMYVGQGPDGGRNLAE